MNCDPEEGHHQQQQQQQQQNHHHQHCCLHQPTTAGASSSPTTSSDCCCLPATPLKAPFLNVAHMMVRQSSDTTQNRIGNSRKLNRSPAFDDEPSMAGSSERPATSCLNPAEMRYCPTQLLLPAPIQHTNVIQTQVVDTQEGAEYIQLNQYRLMEEIAQGSYGIVKLAYSEQDRNLYALKVLDKLKLVKNFACFRPPPVRNKKADKNANGSATTAANSASTMRLKEQQLAVHRNPLQLVQREIAILKKLAHPNVVKLVEVLDDPQDNFLYMVFEYVERRSLMDLPTDDRLSEHVAWKYFRDTLKGLEYLHYQKIVHRDLKPSNLLLSESELVKIADFGVSCEFEGIDAFLTGTAGTPAFMAPEALSENSNQFYSGRAQDIWSLGITLYALVFGNVPWYDAYVIALYKRIKTEPLQFPDYVMISDLLKSLILGMLQKDPGLRYDIAQIKEHPWVTKNARVPMPTEQENCTLVTVTQEEVNQAVRIIPHLGTLILVKAMGRKKHFGNPFRDQQHQSLGSPQHGQPQSLRNRRKSSSLRDPLYPSIAPGSPARSNSRERLPSSTFDGTPGTPTEAADRLQHLKLEEKIPAAATTQNGTATAEEKRRCQSGKEAAGEH